MATWASSGSSYSASSRLLALASPASISPLALAVAPASLLPARSAAAIETSETALPAPVFQLIFSASRACFAAQK